MWPHTDGTLATVDGGRIVAEDQTVTRVEADGTPLWRYDCAGRPRAAHVSGDRMLVLTDSLDYHPWGFLGPALLIDLGDGRLVAELRGERGAPVSEGRVLVGLEGYDTFDTWLHDRDGTLVTTWRSYGHYVPDPDGTIRVVECDRVSPTAARVVRLLPDGRIERGPRLGDGQVPAPAVLPDGTIVVLDAGVLRAVDRDLHTHVLARLLRVPEKETWRFHGRLALDGDRLTVTITERHPDPKRASRRQRWTFTVASGR